MQPLNSEDDKQQQYQHAQQLISAGDDSAVKGIAILKNLAKQDFSAAKLALSLHKLKSSPPTFDFQGAKQLLDSVSDDPTGTKYYLLAEWYGAKLLKSEDQNLLQLAQQNFTKAAECGHVEAMLQLAYGFRHGLFIDKDSPAGEHLGCPWLEKAAKAGHPRALFELAIHKAIGIGCDKDVLAARHNLDAAIEYNYPNAAAMGANFENSIKTVYRPQYSSIELHHEPKICSLKRVLDVMECSHLAVLSMPFLQPSKVISTFGEAELVSGRRSMGTNFPPYRSDFVVNSIVRKLSKIAGQAPDTAEYLALLKYGEGEEYRVHADYFEPNNEQLNNVFEQGGQRLKTIVCYLNTVAQGGATAFPDLGVVVSAKAGDAVFFENADEDATIYPQSRHAGLPIKQGSKWIVTLWFRERTYGE